MTSTRDLEERIALMCREGRYREAAELRLAQGDPARAAELYAAVWDFADAIATAEGAGLLDEAYRHAAAAGDRARASELLSRMVDDPARALRAAAHAEAKGWHADAGRLREIGGEIEAAASLYERGGELFEAARCLEAQGKYREAGRLYERRLRESSDDGETALRLGRILAHFGRYDHAIRALQKAAEDKEHRGGALRMLIASFSALGLDDAAASWLDELRRDDPTLPVTVGEFLEESFGDSRGIAELADATAQGMDPSRWLAGRYRIVRPLGAGATGRVLLGHDAFYDRDVAIKVLTVGEGVAGRDAFARFAREARVAAGVDHPNVVRVFEFNPDGPFLVMEHMSGGTLEDRLAAAEHEGARLDPPFLRHVLRSVLEGLEAVHRRGVTHRDLKPANVFFGAAGEVKIGDFGVAHLADLGATLTGAMLGTLAYMAPEQITGSKRPDASTDLYALGVILYRAVTGRLPFPGPDFVTQHLQTTPAPPSAVIAGLGSDYDRVVASLLEKDTSDRPRTAAEARAILDALPWRPIGVTPRRDRAEPARTPTPLPPRTDERFVVIRPLPSGAALARDTILDRSVRIVPCDAAGAKRLRTLAAADSPFVQAIYDVDPSSGRAVLEEPGGVGLAETSLDDAARAAMLAQIGSALEKLHSIGVAHGQLDADHVRISPGRAVLLLTDEDTAGASPEMDWQALERLR